MIPYRPSLPLKESYHALYKIYVLKHPDTDEIFYVGQTKNELSERLAGHIRQEGSNTQKIEYIKEIVASGKNPIIKEIETIKATCYIDEYFVDEREAFWIKHYRSIGCQLLNISKSGSNEYRAYLASIKKGESSYQYYYCGETYGGIKVYDTERMSADGFCLPSPTNDNSKKYNPPKIEYNPYENKRFLNMLGGKNVVDINFRGDWYFSLIEHDPCYKDTDPDFYDDDY